MNRYRIIFLLIVLNFLLAFQHLHAQKGKDYLMVWGEGGYSALFTKWDTFKTRGSGGGGIGFGYSRLTRNNFIFSIGVEYLSLNSSVFPKDFLILRGEDQDKEIFMDTQNDEYIMQYDIHRLTQIDKTHSVFLPVYIGFKTNSRNKIDYYMQAGGKIGYTFAANYISKIPTYTTIGIYDRYFDPFEEMPNHYFDTQHYKDKKPLNLNKIQAVLSMEMGFDFPLIGEKYNMRVGLFAEYGLINRQINEINNKKMDLFIFDNYPVREERIPNIFSLNSLYETDYKLSTKTHSFLAGVKVTLLLDVTRAPAKRKCLSCPSPSKNKYKGYFNYRTNFSKKYYSHHIKRHKPHHFTPKYKRRR